MRVLSRHLRHLRRFRNDDRGAIAVMFGLLAVPMVMFVGVAVDYSRILAADRELQEAVDAAAIAAAVYKMEKKAEAETGQGSDNDKTTEQVAIDYVRQNSRFRHFDVVVPEETEGEEGDFTLTVRAKAAVPTTFARLVVKKVDIEVEAKTRMAGDPIPLCLLGLNRSASQAVKAWGSGEVVASECAVLSNSTAADGLVTGGSATMEAQAFCSAGGTSGNGFTPRAYSNCQQQSDPYQDMFTKEALEAAGLTVPGTCQQTDYIANSSVTFNAGGDIYTFCGGLDIRANKTVTLGPGIYLIFGELHINANATLLATQGTTLIMGDARWMPGQQDGYIDMQGNGNLLLTAPTAGPTASMALVQPTVSNYTGSSTVAITHTVTGGGNIEIVGNWYTPQAKTLITGNGEINPTSAYFSLISDFVEVEGNGSLQIRAGGDPDAVAMTAVPGRMTEGRFITLIK